ncbi:MAG: SurA N-terminal domain-containing protein [bacterium]
MLDFLRRFYAHTAGKIITILVGLFFIVGFSFLPYIMGVGRSVSPDDVAMVAGKGISLNDLNEYYGKLENEYERLYGNKLTRKELGELNLTGSALSSLIADRVLESKKDAFGIHVSNRFIAKNIASFPEFQKNGNFSSKLFKTVLLDNHTTPADFEKKYIREITRTYIRRIIGESFSLVDMQFLNDYKIKNKSVSFEIALFNSKSKADDFLKKAVLYDKGFAGQAKKSGGTVFEIPLFSEADLVKSVYFKKYSLSGSILKSVFSTGQGAVASMVFPVKSSVEPAVKPRYAAIKILKVYFPEYIADAKDKNGKDAMKKQKELYGFQQEQKFLNDYVDYLESKSNVKINRNALSEFHPY